MLKSEDCNEFGKPIIKNEYSDIENVIEETDVKHEPVECVKCEELYIKDELESGEERCASVSAPETADSNSSGDNDFSKRKTQIKISESKEEQLHFCPDCPFSSKWKQNLLRHKRSHAQRQLDRGTSSICPNCSFSSKWKWNLERHKLTHSDRHLDRQSSEETFKCHYCDFKSNHRGNLNKHIGAIHERDKATVYACQQCTYKTIRTSSLRRHLRLHGGKVSPHKCPGCEKEFSEQRTLDDHLLKKHENLQHLIITRIYDCKFCNYKSAILKELKGHITLKHDRNNAEIFQCHNCSFFTVHRDSLIAHLAVHSNLRAHQCPSCKKGFNRKDTLESHMVHKHKNALLLKNITRKIHECTSCNFKTVRKTYLGRHIQANHK